MKNQVIKPIATALWLIKNTKLTFLQISNFTGLTELEINAMADGFEKSSLEPNNPIKIGQLTQEELTKCENNPKANLQLSGLPIFNDIQIKVSKKTYVSLAKRKEKLTGALFLLEKHPILPIESVMKLTGATRKMVEGLVNQTYSKLNELSPKDPTISRLCTQVKLNEELAKYSKNAETK